MQRKNAECYFALMMVASTYSATWLHHPRNTYAEGMSFESLPAFLEEGRPVSLSIQRDPPSSGRECEQLVAQAQAF